MDESQAQELVDDALGEGYFLVPCPQGWVVVAEARPGRTAVGSRGTYVVSASEQALIGFPVHLSAQQIRRDFTALRDRGWVQAAFTAA